MSDSSHSYTREEEGRQTRGHTHLMTKLGILLLMSIAAATHAGEPAFPVKAELFIDAFQAAEGITFNGEGKLFIAANRAAWLAEPDGSVTKLVDTYTNLGMAGIGERDILMADFGPTNVFNHGENDDGIVWRITPEGKKTVAANGIADPNFILVLQDRSYLVSDDGTNKIYRVTPDNEMTLWTTAIDYPNGMALSLDGKTLYVAQIFKQLKPIAFDDKVWALPMAGYQPAGKPILATRVGEALDGLAMDELGRVYIADNFGGKLWRFNPKNDELVLIAEGMPHIASMVFGEGDFDNHAIYATCTFRGGGKIWKIPAGAKGARQYR